MIKLEAVFRKMQTVGKCLSPERMATAPQRVFHISIIVFNQLNADDPASPGCPR